MAVKPGARALGIAESARGDDRSTLAGAVVRADRVVDGLAFRSCTVGGTDATGAVRTLWDDLAREDVRYLFLGAIAPARYNLLDVGTIAAHVDRPTMAITFAESEGLEPALREAFSGDGLEARLDTYRSLPPRRERRVNGERVYVRSVGIDDDDADAIVEAYTPTGGRPEPLRVARMAARAADNSRLRGKENT